MAADPANTQLQHTIDIKVITDGEHHVLDRLDPPYRGLFQMVVPSLHLPSISVLRPSVSSPVGLDQDYDLYALFRR